MYLVKPAFQYDKDRKDYFEDVDVTRRVKSRVLLLYGQMKKRS